VSDERNRPDADQVKDGEIHPPTGVPRSEGPRAVAAAPSREAEDAESAEASPERLPARSEPQAGGGLPLTREHLEGWIEQLRASRAGETGQTEAERDPRDLPGSGLRGRVPDRDVVFVGRASAGMAAGAGHRQEKSRLSALSGGRPQTSAEADPRRRRFGSAQRTVVLSLVLALLLIWMAASLNLGPFRGVEVPTTLNSLNRIT